MRTAIAALAFCVSVASVEAQFRTHNDRLDPPRFASISEWNARANYVRQHVLASAGLLPMPARTPLNPVVFGDIRHSDYIVSKVYFESLPGFFVTGNMYRPVGQGPFPAILSPHGHWTNGRLENTPIASIPGRAIGLARQGFVVFSHDMIGYNDSRQLMHTFGGRREALWGLSLGGLQLWNSIRALDFLETLPYVRKDGFGVTGESGGGTQTFMLGAVDPRVAVAAPVNMISLHMQGGCLCENMPGLRLDINNVEIGATIAPRPMLMVSATGDWTAETLENEFPATRAIYALFSAPSKVAAVRMNAEHNYNKDSREAMYAWMARWLQGAAEDSKRAEATFSVDPVVDLLVFHGRALPPGAVTAAQLTDAWIAASKAQIVERRSSSKADPELTQALSHALGFAGVPRAAPVNRVPGAVAAVVASDRGEVAAALRAAGFRVTTVTFTPFDQTAAEKVRHFETYNRTPASQRVADIVAALRTYPAAVLVADGAAALPALLATTVVPVRRAIIDVDRFDTSDDQQFLDRVYIPGLRRAGDFQTAAGAARGELIVHNAGDNFVVGGIRVESRPLSVREIAAIARAR